MQEIGEFERQLRPDVQRHLGLPHALVGFRLQIDAPGLRAPADLDHRFRVIAGKRQVLVSGPPIHAIRGGAK